jgi:hypothetical protein
MSYKGTAIIGRATARAEQMEARTRSVNPGAPALAELYLTLGGELGVRGDLAYAQALLETNYFRYGRLVQPAQNNYAGIGATGPGQPGASFATPLEGVLAHLQHLYAYASTEPLREGMPEVDPRFDLVTRGIATHIGDLNGRWAVPGNDYGQSIDRILGAILMERSSAEPHTITNAYLSPSSKNRPGPCTSSGCWQGVQGIVVHRTASPSQNARAIRNYFNESPDGRFASSQFVLDNNEILVLMPPGEVAYHTVGANFTTLGIETCEHNWGSPAWEETYRKLVWLTGYLARSFHLSIGQVKGHFEYDPVNRPYDPTHPGWELGDGKATGLFVWRDFLADVQAEMNRERAGEEPSGELPGLLPGPIPEVIPVQVVRGGAEACQIQGRLIEAQTFVPIRPYTACVAPGMQVDWIEGERRVVVAAPAADAGPAAPDGETAVLDGGPTVPGAPGGATPGSGGAPQAGGSGGPGAAPQAGGQAGLTDVEVRERRRNRNLTHREFNKRVRATRNRRP